MLTNRVGMLTDVDGWNDITCRMRITVIDIVGRMMVIDNEICLKYGLRRCVDRCQDISSRMTIIDVFDVFNRITVIDNGVWFGVLTKSVDRCEAMLTKGVDGCKDVFSRMIVIDNGVNGCMDVSSIFSRI